MKTDFKKAMKELYSAPTDQPVIVTVPELNYIAIDGSGDPNGSQEYQDAMNALYGIAYPLKFRLKKDGLDYVVPPLEGLWWTEDMATFSIEHKENWQWTMMIMQPELVTQQLFAEVRDEQLKKKGLAAFAQVELVSHQDGLSAQIMHLGPYSGEGPTIAKLHHFIVEAGYQLRGKHREIYLTDPNKSAPDKMRTIIRQPIEPSRA